MKKLKLSLISSALIILTACTSTKKDYTISPYSSDEQARLNHYQTSYEQGEYKDLIKTIQADLKMNNSITFQQEALKYKAFSECLSNMVKQCRMSFRSLFKLNPEFSLSVAEENHPSWKKIYAGEKNRALPIDSEKLIIKTSKNPAKPIRK